MKTERIKFEGFISIGSDMSTRGRLEGFHGKLVEVPSDMSEAGRQGIIPLVEQVNVVK